MNIHLSPKVLAKITARSISKLEIEQCFHNVEHGYLEDVRAQHLTDPVTKWFVAETDKGRQLKIMFVPEPTGVSIKSAYEASTDIINIYEKHSVK